MSNPVDGPVSSIVGNVPMFANIYGNLLADSGVSIIDRHIISDGLQADTITSASGTIDFCGSQIFDTTAIYHNGMQGATGSYFDECYILQSGYNVTGFDQTWTTAMIGGLLKYSDGSVSLIKQVPSSNSLVVDESKNITCPQKYSISYDRTCISKKNIGALQIITDDIVLNTISEKTTNSGCTIDGLLIKDGNQVSSSNTTTYSFTQASGSLSISLEKISNKIVYITIPSTLLTKTTSTGQFVSSSTIPSSYIPSVDQPIYPIAEVNGTRVRIAVLINTTGQIVLSKDINYSSFSVNDTLSIGISNAEQTFKYHL